VHPWNTLQKFGIWGFCLIFLQKYCDSLKRASIFGKAPQRFWAIIAKFGFFGFLWMTGIAKFGYLGGITKFVNSVFLVFVPIIQKIGELSSKPNSVNPLPCQSVC
jgi:hypothetical protein